MFCQPAIYKTLKRVLLKSLYMFSLRDHNHFGSKKKVNDSKILIYVSQALFRLFCVCV